MLVSDIKYEKYAVNMDGDNFDDSRDFKFSIPASSDYFTR
jgi:hypothetical protein